MIKNSAFIVLSLMLVLSACASPAPAETNVPVANTEAPVESATNTLEPVPTATAALEPQIINAGNVASLSFQELVDVPRKPNVWYPVFTNDSQKILMTTEAGVDVLNASTLELEASYPGLRIDGSLSDGRLYGFQSDTFVFFDVQSGETTPVGVQLTGGAYAISPKGDKVAYAPDDVTLQVFDLAAPNQSISISAENLYYGSLFFNGDGTVLVASLDLGYPDWSAVAYDSISGEELYQSDDSLLDPINGELMLMSSTSAIVPSETRTIVDNQKVSEFPGFINVPGTVSGIPNPEAPSEGAELWFEPQFASFSQDGKRAVETAYGGYSGEIQSITTMDMETLSALAVVNLTEKFVEPVTRSPYPILLPSVYIAPDGNTFVVTWPDGKVELRKFETAEVLAESDRFGNGSSSMAISPEGSLIAWADLQGVNVYNWQSGEFVLQVSHSNFTKEVGRVGFVDQETLFVDLYDSLFEASQWGFWETINFANVYFWDLTSGQVKKSVIDRSLCDVPQGGSSMKCAAFEKDSYGYIRLTGTKIFNTSNSTNELVTAKLNEYVVASPTGEGYAKCTADREGITLKEGKAAALTLPYLCQPSFFGKIGEGLYLFLQNGAVIDVATGEEYMQLDVREIGYAFDAEFTYSDEWLYDAVLSSHIGTLPQFFSGDGFIMINNNVFDSQSGELLIQLSSVKSVSGITMSEDGQTLMLLTGRGLEKWQVLQ